MKTKYEKIRCKVMLSEDEIQQAAEALATKTQELDEIELEKKASNAAFKERMERVSGEIRTAGRLYRDKFDMRDVECEVMKDYDSGVIRYIRTDTFETAKTETMTHAERQRHIDEVLQQEDDDEKLTESDEKARIEADMHQQQVQREMAAETSAL
jgi:hypothetical protein